MPLLPNCIFLSIISISTWTAVPGWTWISWFQRCKA